MKAIKSTKTADNKLAVNRRASKKEKAVKDPNKPKRPPSAFFVFMEEFRKTYKEKFPLNKSVAVVGKAGGEKWKLLSDVEKGPYVAKAAKRKTEYTKILQAYNDKLANGGDEEDGSDKSKSEVNDDEHDEEASGEEGDKE